jgi:DNA polymerase III subunit delta
MTDGFQEISSKISRDQISNLYLILSEETFLVEEILAQLEAKVLGEGLKDFNFNCFYAADAEATQIKEAVEQLPMMSTARLVIVKEAQSLNESDWETLASVIENPVSSSVLVFVASKLDKRKKSAKRLLEAAHLVEMKKPYENQVTEWVGRLAKRHGLQLSGEATESFRQLVGESLNDINSELLKLSQAVAGPKKNSGTGAIDMSASSSFIKISAGQVVNIVSRARIDTVFDLTDAIGSGDRIQALSNVVHLLDAGESAVGVVSMIARHIRILRSLLAGSRLGLVGPKLAVHAGIAPFFLKNYSSQVHNWNETKLDDALISLAATDRALKSSPLAAHIWLENLVLRTCQ